MVDVEIRAPEPGFTDLEALLPFNVEAALVETVFNIPAIIPPKAPWWPNFPAHPAQNTTWTPAKPRLPPPDKPDEQPDETQPVPAGGEPPAKELWQWGDVNKAWGKSDPGPAVTAWTRLTS